MGKSSVNTVLRSGFKKYIKPERKLSILPFPSVFIKLGQQFFGRYNCFRWPRIQIPVALRLSAFIR
jgi:hypothetical protein